MNTYCHTHFNHLNRVVLSTIPALAYRAAMAWGHADMADEQDGEDAREMRDSPRPALWHVFDDHWACEEGLTAVQNIRTPEDLGTKLARWGRADWLNWLHGLPELWRAAEPAYLAERERIAQARAQTPARPELGSDQRGKVPQGFCHKHSYYLEHTVLFTMCDTPSTAAAMALGNARIAAQEDQEDWCALRATAPQTSVWKTLRELGACHTGLTAIQGIETWYDLGVALARWGRRDWYEWVLDQTNIHSSIDEDSLKAGYTGQTGDYE